jgi:hypothetical protein
MKDVLVDNQSDMIQQMDAETETEVELVAIKARDGNCEITKHKISIEFYITFNT